MFVYEFYYYCAPCARINWTSSSLDGKVAFRHIIWNNVWLSTNMCHIFSHINHAAARAVNIISIHVTKSMKLLWFPLFYFIKIIPSSAILHPYILIFSIVFHPLDSLWFLVALDVQKKHEFWAFPYANRHTFQQKNMQKEHEEYKKRFEWWWWR